MLEYNETSQTITLYDFETGYMKRHMKDAIILTSVLLFLVTLLIGVSIMAHPPQNDSDKLEQYAVIFPPSLSKTQTFKMVVESGGYPVRKGATNFIIISASNNPDHIKELKKHGALLVFDPVIKGACISEDKTTFQVTKNI